MPGMHLRRAVFVLGNVREKEMNTEKLINAVALVTMLALMPII